MAFHVDRKLMFGSLDNSTGKTCRSYYCNPEKYHSRTCPLSCFYICEGICMLPEIELPPLPPKVPRSQSPNKHTVSIFLIILLVVTGIGFYIFCSFVIHKFRNSRTSSQQEQQVEEEFNDIRTAGLQPSVINAITICKYKRGEGLIEGTECSVCLSEFQEDETLRILPKCNHTFHIPCIDTWLTSNTNCPMCRAGIVITPAAASSSPQQNSRMRHEEEAHAGISENATELTLDIENEGELVDESSIDIGGNSKEDLRNGTNE